MGPPWKEGEIRLRVDNVPLWSCLQLLLYLDQLRHFDTKIFGMFWTCNFNDLCENKRLIEIIKSLLVKI